MPQVNFPEAFHKALLALPEKQRLVFELTTKREAYGVKMSFYKFLAQCRAGTFGSEKQGIAVDVTVRQITPFSGVKDSCVELVHGGNTSLNAVFERAMGKDDKTVREEQWLQYVEAMSSKRCAVLTPTAEQEAQWRADDEAKAREIGVDFMTNKAL